MEPDSDLDAMLSEPVRAHHPAIIIVTIIIIIAIIVIVLRCAPIMRSLVQ